MYKKFKIRSLDFIGSYDHLCSKNTKWKQNCLQEEKKHGEDEDKKGQGDGYAQSILYTCNFLCGP